MRFYLQATAIVWLTLFAVLVCAPSANAQQASVGVAPALADRSDDEPGPAEHVVTLLNRGDDEWTADLSVHAVSRVDDAWQYDPLPGWTVMPDVVTLPPNARIDVVARGDAPEAIAVTVTPRGQSPESIGQVSALAWLATEPPPGVTFPEAPPPPPDWWDRHGPRLLAALGLLFIIWLAYATGQGRAEWVARRRPETSQEGRPRTRTRAR